MSIDAGHLVQLRRVEHNMVFGGEGLFNTVITRLGEMMIRTIPIMKLAGSIGRCISVSK